MKLFVGLALLAAACGAPDGGSYGAPQGLGQQAAVGVRGTSLGPVYGGAAGQFAGVTARGLGGAQSRDAQARTISEENVHPGDGTYQFSFETDNGIRREEEGDGRAVSGSYSYLDESIGQEITITFVADENGFQPEGLALPTPVPTEYPTPVVPLTDEAFPSGRQGQTYGPPQGQQNFGRTFNNGFSNGAGPQSYAAPEQQAFSAAPRQTYGL